MQSYKQNEKGMDETKQQESPYSKPKPTIKQTKNHDWCTDINIFTNYANRKIADND